LVPAIFAIVEPNQHADHAGYDKEKSDEIKFADVLTERFAFVRVEVEEEEEESTGEASRWPTMSQWLHEKDYQRNARTS
jgi:hypothetical protein